MGQPGAFVPAWKRLGLKVKTFPESKPGHSDEIRNNQTSAKLGSAVQKESNVDQTNQDKFKLGKRKHHADVVDIESEPLKKSKHVQEVNLTDVHTVVAPPPGVKEPLKSATDEEPPADKANSTGDPNYRKKKTGDTNYRKKSEPKNTHKGQRSSQSNTTRGDSLSVPDLVASQNARTPSLSPGQTDALANGSTLLPSTESDFTTSVPWTTPKKQKAIKTKDSSLSSSPPKTDRRKSVTFTPDTKTGDGNSASNLFKKWVADQKGQGGDFSPAEVAQFAEPPKVHIANNDPYSTQQASTSTPPTKSRKKDSSRYLNYLTQYHQNRANWKFNKAIQNDVLDNSLNIFRIPEEYSDALLEYVRGLKGAGVIERLKERCTKTIQEVDQEESKANMDEPKVRQAAKDAALEERVSKEQKRRQVESDVEKMLDHPNTDGYIRRLKRSRAQALFKALNMAAPAFMTPQSGLASSTKPKFVDATASVAHTNPRKRKRRADVSSDESSDSSSSEEESSSSEENSDEDSSSESASGSDDEENSSDSVSDSKPDPDSDEETDGNSSEEDGEVASGSDRD